jgi:hypothetical protein
VAWLLLGTSYNVVIALLFHFVVNTGFFMLTNALTDLRFMMLNGILWVIVAAILVMLKRKDFYSPVRKMLGGKSCTGRDVFDKNGYLLFIN